MEASVKLEDLLDKYIVIEKRDGKYIKGILVEVKRKEETIESSAYTTLILRMDNDTYQNVHLIEVENIGEME